MDGGLTKMSSASGTLARTCRAPWGSIVRMASRPGREDAAHLVDRRAVQVAVHLRPLEQPTAVTQPDEVVAIEEVIVDAVDLALAPLAGGRGHDRHNLRVAARQLGDDGALADPRWA